mmetsp:Transcript_109403/g.265930  ORF Transcript_109403/g.265930 Transcript_109403/m.265930 type:complete len:210 (+) Transcript_109403:744-1373(+)
MVVDPCQLAEGGIPVCDVDVGLQLRSSHSLRQEATRGKSRNADTTLKGCALTSEERPIVGAAAVVEAGHRAGVHWSTIVATHHQQCLLPHAPLPECAYHGSKGLVPIRSHGGIHPPVEGPLCGKPLNISLRRLQGRMVVLECNVEEYRNVEGMLVQRVHDKLRVHLIPIGAVPSVCRFVCEPEIQKGRVVGRIEGIRRRVGETTDGVDT